MARRFCLMAGLLASLLVLPGVSNATCTINGLIVRVLAYDDAFSATGGFIYFRPSTLAPYYYFVSTNDDEMIGNAIDHMNSVRYVQIQGNVAGCPAVPAAGGSASLGSLNYISQP